MDLFKFFIEENRSGKKSKEVWLKKHYPDLYENIIQNTNWDISFVEKIYLYINNLTEPPKCLNCNKSVNFKGTLKKGYNKFCSINCLNSSNYHKEKIKKTFQNKFNVDSHNQIKSVKNKKKQTCLKKYGVDNPMKVNSIKLKQKNKLIENYGVDNPMRIPHVIDNIKKNVLFGNEKNINKVINKLQHKYKFIKHENQKFYFICNECNNEFDIDANLLNARYINDNIICLKCNPLKSFTGLYNKIKPHIKDINHILNDRKEIKKEIDVFFPQHNIGVELNGLYWHSEKFKDKKYHINKTLLANEKNIKLLHFFEDEILYKSEIVSSIIKAKLNLFIEKIYARNCVIKDVDNKTQRMFLEKNHIQGNVNAKYKYGLYYNNKLVSLMTFGRLRKSLGNKNVENEFELLRFCSLQNTIVVGGAGKLLKHFIREIKPKKIITYANLRYYDGHFYEKLGFKLVGKTEPNYWYFKLNNYTKKRYNRYKFRKDVLVKNGFDPKKSERQIMFEQNYLRIYDCGNKKYEMDCK